MAAAALVAAEDPYGYMDFERGEIEDQREREEYQGGLRSGGRQHQVTVDGVDKDGKAIHNEWTGKFDGKDYPLTGDATAIRAVTKRPDTHTLTLDNKKGGKTILTGKVTIAADGKSRTLVTSGTDSRRKESQQYFRLRQAIESLSLGAAHGWRGPFFGSGKDLPAPCGGGMVRLRFWALWATGAEENLAC